MSRGVTVHRRLFGWHRSSCRSSPSDLSNRYGSRATGHEKTVRWYIVELDPHRDARRTHQLPSVLSFSLRRSGYGRAFMSPRPRLRQLTIRIARLALAQIGSRNIRVESKHFRLKRTSPRPSPSCFAHMRHRSPATLSVGLARRSKKLPSATYVQSISTA